MQSLKLLGFKYVAKGKKSSANSRFDIVGFSWNFRFASTFLQSRKLKGNELPTISKQRHVSGQLRKNEPQTGKPKTE